MYFKFRQGVQDFEWSLICWVQWVEEHVHQVNNLGA